MLGRTEPCKALSCLDSSITPVLRETPRDAARVGGGFSLHIALPHWASRLRQTTWTGCSSAPAPTLQISHSALMWKGYIVISGAGLRCYQDKGLEKKIDCEGVQPWGQAAQRLTVRFWAGKSRMLMLDRARQLVYVGTHLAGLGFEEDNILPGIGFPGLRSDRAIFHPLCSSGAPIIPR
ncbi:hypothetical protein BO71DRAFT_433874 [Aspergillus ellipticus CBS 707.79]|uniref:Uncharacterized protein n=1 Tax=Aspergillus ellipticus CBS 707.79 TaxID=1448320 RepID=A0A319D082_9EURO|nr:hypothetical protein BO71DRAFT_433874 [Aspergillus ellipticus CBS 707.79]